MKLVKATEQDFQRLTQFYRDVIAHTEDMDRNARWVYGQHPTDEMLRRYIQADAMYCCEKDGSIISAAAVTPQGEDYHGTVWAISLFDDEVSVVHLLCVAPKLQKQGVARATMGLVAELSRNMGKKAVRLDALACNTPAHRLYESLGFQKRDQRRWFADNVGWADFYLYELVFQESIGAAQLIWDRRNREKAEMKCKTFVSALLAAILLVALTACTSAGAPQENAQPYDYYIDCTTREQLAALADEDFVEELFAFSLMQFALPGSGTGQERRLMLLTTEYFDHIDTSSFERRMCIQEDPAILQSPARNPILIDEALSKAEGLSVGDTLALPNRLTEQPVVFTAGAIYHRTSLFAQYDAVILCSEQINPIFYAVEENMRITAAYVKASDLQGLTDYPENKFVPGLLVNNSGLTQAEIDAIPREDIAAYYESYADHQRRQ